MYVSANSTFILSDFLTPINFKPAGLLNKNVCIRKRVEDLKTTRKSENG
jgi:hypothetical protein